MSKNVAVFVDVANIFYAAKAAGVDIDYTTLLKTATAGRDFVRAYAYTGLDPDNDNQRQFHSFLARSGYKVVSKDIRKYGDGKVKANLDIELVVDMMRTAQNLDIAVVVSGDGDFAPAIRAVQQMGVRVEVISFRGNTSSDLIEVADTFIDITQIAKVEKGSSRSGRRVAAEDDLSMTEVPDKESEGAPRRGRGGRGRGRSAEREDAPVAAAPVEAPTRGRRTTATGADLVVLPGEKLSKVAATAATPEDVELDDEDVEPEPIVEAADDVDGIDAAEVGARPDGEGEVDGEGHRRRRRRRGGRGRGRGRGQDREVPTEAGAPGMASAAGSTDEDEEDEDLDAYPAPRTPQASTFGSVWDSQIGVPSAPLASADLSGSTAEDEDEDEPEIPEYLLAERRQRAGRPGGRPAQPGRGRGGRPGGRGGAYQSAVDRERYGRSGGSAFGGNSGNSGACARGPIAGLDRTADPATAAARRGPIAGRAPIGRRRAPHQPRPMAIPGARSRPSWRRCCAPSSPARALPRAAARRPRRPLALRPSRRPGRRRDARPPRPRRPRPVTTIDSVPEAEAKPKRRAPARKAAATEAPTSASVAEDAAAYRGQAEAPGTRPEAGRDAKPPRRRSAMRRLRPTPRPSRSVARAHARPPRRPESVAGFRTRGQPAALDIVARAVVSERPPNAILIAGPERVGKTTLALDLAAGLLCLADDPAERPCRSCVACRKVEHGNHPDLHRVAPVGAGGQIRIDQARSLIVDLALLPLEGRFRVAIVAAAQRLNPDAQNALLKTLEEPPAGAVLILCADDETLLLDTVRSRCARIRCGAVAAATIAELLVERGAADPSTAAGIARLADGRPGLAMALAASPDVLVHRARLARSLLDLTEAGRRQRLAAGPALLADAATVAEVIERRDGELAPDDSAARRRRTRRRPTPASGREAVGDDTATVAMAPRVLPRRTVAREPRRRSVAPHRSRSSRSGATWPGTCWSCWPVAPAWCETSPCSRTTSGSRSAPRSTTSPHSWRDSMAWPPPSRPMPTPTWWWTSCSSPGPGRGWPPERGHIGLGGHERWGRRAARGDGAAAASRGSASASSSPARRGAAASSGWVRNEADGAVHVVAEGRPADLDGFLEALRHGPPGAVVREVRATRGPAVGLPATFEIRPGGHRGD